MHWPEKVGFSRPLATSLLHGKIVEIGLADSCYDFWPHFLAEPWTPTHFTSLHFPSHYIIVELLFSRWNGYTIIHCFQCHPFYSSLLNTTCKPLMQCHQHWMDVNLTLFVIPYDYSWAFQIHNVAQILSRMNQFSIQISIIHNNVSLQKQVRCIMYQSLFQ